MSYDAPNHTQTPNSFFDDTLRKTESMSELKIVLAIIRQTFGWHQDEGRISLSRFQELTGLSRQGALDGIRAAKEHGIIADRREGQNIYYRLLVNDLDQSTEETGTSLKGRPVTGQQIRPKPVYGLDPLNKERKKKQKNGKQSRFLSGKFSDDIQH